MGKFKRARRVPGLLGVLALVSMSLAAVAIADTVLADGDGLTPVGNNNMALGTIGCNVATSDDALLAIIRAGSGNVFKNGSTATVTVTGITGANAPAVSTSFVGGNTILLPSNWESLSNGAQSPTVTSHVTVQPTVSGSGTATINYQAVGTESDGTPIPPRTDSMNVTWTAGTCAPPDTTAPTSSATAKNADDSAYTFGNWTNQNVTVTLSGEDNEGGSGLKEIRYTTDGTDPTATSGTVYSAPFTISTEGTTTLKWRAIDNSSNLEAIHTETVKVDKAAPEITCGAADGLWHADDVSIACTASDARSGVSPASDASFSLSTNVSAGTETNNAQTGTKEISDAAGNKATAGPIGGNKVDKKAPEVSCGSPDGLWHADDVSIACTASDGGSGVNPESDESFSLSTNVPADTETNNAQTNSKVVSDLVGHTTTAGPIAGNKVDKKAPEVSCGSPDGAWHGSDVSIACTATDGGSGVDPESDESFDLSTNVPAGTETNNAQTDSKVVSDALGHTTTAGPIGGNKVDKKAPWISCGSADGLWHADNVDIPCSASDNGSGIAEADESFNLSTNVAAGQENDNASTDSRPVTDAVGNTATAGAVGGNKIDRKAPSVSCGSADGLWHANNVSIACTASDGGSGIALADQSFNLSTNVADGQENNNASTGSRPVTDGVGHTTTAGPIPGNKIDRKGPSITCPTPVPSFTVGQSPATVTGSASDGGSGVQGSTSPSSPVDTSSVVGNPKSVILSSTDNVNNVTNQNCAYNVLYGFAGFFQPIDNNGVFNKAKAGSAIPVKFSLDGPPQPGSDTPGLAGASSAFLTPPVTTLATCPTATSLVDLIEEFAADSVSGLKYDPSADQWVYVWKTTTNLANSCRQLKVTLADGSVRTANFQFTK